MSWTPRPPGERSCDGGGHVAGCAGHARSGPGDVEISACREQWRPPQRIARPVTRSVENGAGSPAGHLEGRVGFALPTGMSAEQKDCATARAAVEDETGAPPGRRSRTKPERRPGRGCAAAGRRRQRVRAPSGGRPWGRTRRSSPASRRRSCLPASPRPGPSASRPADRPAGPPPGWRRGHGR